MAKPPDKAVKNITTELYRDDGSENKGVPRWYRLFIINYVDGSGQMFKFLLDKPRKGK